MEITKSITLIEFHSIKKSVPKAIFRGRLFVGKKGYWHLHPFRFLTYSRTHTLTRISNVCCLYKTFIHAWLFRNSLSSFSPTHVNGCDQNRTHSQTYTCTHARMHAIVHPNKKANRLCIFSIRMELDESRCFTAKLFPFWLFLVIIQSFFFTVLSLSLSLLVHTNTYAHSANEFVNVLSFYILHLVHVVYLSHLYDGVIHTLGILSLCVCFEWCAKMRNLMSSTISLTFMFNRAKADTPH